MNIEFVEKDQNWQEEHTMYWFEVNGESWGVRDKLHGKDLIDCDGCPVEACNDHDGVLELLLPHAEKHLLD